MFLTQLPRDRRPQPRGCARLHGEQSVGNLGCARDSASLLARESRANSLGDASGELPQSRWLTVSRRERESARVAAPQNGGEATESVWLATSESVGCDIRIATRDNRDSSSRERTNDCERGFCGLLKVIDNHELEPRDALARVVGSYSASRELGELSGVELACAVVRDHIEVLVDEGSGCHPLRPLHRLTKRAQACRTHAVLGCASHEFTKLGPEAAQPSHLRPEGVGPLRVARRAVCVAVDLAFDEFGNVAVLFTACDESGRFSPGEPRRVTNDLER